MHIFPFLRMSEFRTTRLSFNIFKTDRHLGNLEKHNQIRDRFGDRYNKLNLITVNLIVIDF